MRNISKILLLASVCLVGIAILFTGGVAAEEAPLAELEGEGSEDDPYVITDVEELQAMNEDLEAHYVLGNDIDASETQTWDAGAGFDPIGSGLDDEVGFHGSLDGRNHTITGLTIDRPEEDYVGLFGWTTGPVENVHLEDVDVTGGYRTGSLAGWTHGDVRYASATGQVDGDFTTGGLVGGVDTAAVIERAAADVDVSTGDFGGGLLAHLREGRVIESYAYGDVRSEDGTVGGLVGLSRSNTEIRNSYATGDAALGWGAGGLVGRNRGQITQSFAIGEARSEVEENTHGGIAGRNYVEDYDARISDSYWDVEASSLTVGSYDQHDATGLRTDAMTGAAAKTNLEAFDFEYFWAATDEYPVLRWQVQDVSVSLDESTVTEGDRTDVTVMLTLDDGSTVSASSVAEYETDGLASVDAGVVETSERGTTEITATVAGHSDTATLEITEPPNIELEDAALEAPAAVVGSEVTATATYANDGGPGGHTAELIADGEVVASDRIRVGADEETTVQFEWTPDGDVGTEYDVSIDETDLGTLTLVGAETVSLESVSIPERVGSGTPYDVSVDLGTDRDEPVVASLAYERGGDRLATESVVIDPEGSTTDFERETDADPGSTLAHAVALGGETVEATSEVAEPPMYEITAVDAPDEVTAGEEFELTVTVENTGDLAGSQRVALSTDGNDVDATELALEADSSDAVSMTVTEDEAGEYEYTVRTDDDEDVASVAVAAPEESNGTESSDESESDDGSDGLPGFTSAVAVVALLSLAVLARHQ